MKYATSFSRLRPAEGVETASGPRFPSMDERAQELCVAEFRAKPGYTVHAPKDALIQLPLDVARSIKELLAGDEIRPGGLQVYAEKERLAPDALNNLVSWHGVDMKSLGDTSVRMRSIAETQNWLRSYLRRNGFSCEEPKVYRVQNALCHALMKDVGWIDQEDLFWFACDHLGLGNEFDDEDSGFFTAVDPQALRHYDPIGGGFGECGEEIYKGLGIDLDRPELERLFFSFVFLEVDLRAFTARLPHGHADAPFLVPRTGIMDHNEGLTAEIIAPFPPILEDDHGCKVLAMVEKLPEE